MSIFYGVKFWKIPFQIVMSCPQHWRYPYLDFCYPPIFSCTVLVCKAGIHWSMLQVFESSQTGCLSCSWLFFPNRCECIQNPLWSFCIFRKCWLFDFYLDWPMPVMGKVLETIQDISVGLGTFSTRTNSHFFVPSACNTRTTFCSENIKTKLKQLVPMSTTIKKILTVFSNFFLFLNFNLNYVRIISYHSVKCQINQLFLNLFDIAKLN